MREPGYVSSSTFVRRADLLKRLFDVCVAGAGMILLLPALLMVGIAIKLDSRGPVFYRAPRTGRYEKPFTMYKFRTMVVGADQLGGPSTAYHDPRLTRVGFFLHRWSLDVLPQLINILKGEMSVVGPRPEVPECTRLYEGEEKTILSVRPGITDYATLELPDLDKVLGDGDPNLVYIQKIWPRKNQLRIKYAREHTLLKDIAIIWRTMFAMLKR